MADARTSFRGKRKTRDNALGELKAERMKAQADRKADKKQLKDMSAAHQGLRDARAAARSAVIAEERRALQDANAAADAVVEARCEETKAVARAAWEAAQATLRTIITVFNP